jgi:hypothetical protein
LRRFGFTINNWNFNFLILLTVITVTFVNLNHERGKAKDVIVHDIIQYHSYLPAFFYEKDLTFSFLNDTLNRQVESKLYNPVKLNNDRYIVKTTMGMALTYLPFFGIAHLFARIFDYPADGFSGPYHLAVLFSSLFYYILGMFFLRKILQRNFSEKVIWIVLFLLTFATNVFYYLTIGGGLSHIAGFTAIAAFIYYTLKWHEVPQIKFAVAIGLLAGFIALVRPVNILVILFFFLYETDSINQVKIKFNLFKKYSWHLAVILACIIVMFFPQMIYWKYITGSYFFNSYVGERFFFGNPHITEGLIGFRKGWLIYTPVMIFAIAGMFFLKNDLRKYFNGVLVFACIYIYVVFSWWCWWYGGSFGQRVMIDIYAVVCIPLAAFLRMALDWKGTRKVFFNLVLVFFVVLNLFQTMQAKYNIIHYDSMTARNYFRVFGTTSKQPDRENYLEHPDYEKARKGDL